VYASVSVARGVGWMRVKSGWCVERDKVAAPGGSKETECE